MLVLCKEVADHVRQALAELPSETKKSRRAPEVYVGPDLPLHKAGTDKEAVFPYVLIFPEEGYDTRESGFVTFRLIFATYSGDDDGWIDAMNALQRVRVAFDSLTEGALPHGRIAEGEKGRQIEWALYDDHAYPHWFAFMRINFEIGRAQFLPGKDQL